MKEAERKLADKLLEDRRREFIPSTGREAQDAQAIFDRLTAASGLDHIPWDLRVLRAPSKLPLTRDTQACDLAYVWHMFQTWEVGFRIH